MYLASFGADVVKVESHQRPDPFRYSTSLPELGEDWWERSAVWQSTNLNKRSLTLDLTNSAAQDIASRFIAQADVLVENFTPRVLDHLGAWV
jgi:crotonobetainyl-CoA:carnitine CoA-transferase CaiB-like acyl-CoA transferase